MKACIRSAANESKKGHMTPLSTGAHRIVPERGTTEKTRIQLVTSPMNVAVHHDSKDRYRGVQRLVRFMNGARHVPATTSSHVMNSLQQPQATDTKISRSCLPHATRSLRQCRTVCMQLPTETRWCVQLCQIVIRKRTGAQLRGDCAYDYNFLRNGADGTDSQTLGLHGVEKLDPRARIPRLRTQRCHSRGFTLSDGRLRTRADFAMPPPCVVCFKPSSVFCLVDQAFLCAECDRLVHESNDDARTHIRVDCNSLDFSSGAVPADLRGWERPIRPEVPTTVRHFPGQRTATCYLTQATVILIENMSVPEFLVASSELER